MRNKIRQLVVAEAQLHWAENRLGLFLVSVFIVGAIALTLLAL